MAFQNLIRLAQIEEGLDLQQDVTSLKTSYDALKVLTNISKGESLGSYNVNELLVSLKATIESITGGEGGSVSGSLVSIQQQIDVINNKTIKDVVKLEMKLVNNVVVLPPNLSELVPNIDTAKRYPVYHIDNTVILNETGGQLLFDFKTNQFIGTPSIVDPDCKDPNHLTYVAIEGDFTFKVFAIGTFTFANLPVDALLDNQEMVVLAYNQVLNQIIVNLANNVELINEIKVLVSNEAIQQQILAITNVLEQRITIIEQNGCKVSNEYTSTVINNVNVAVDTKVTTEKAVAVAIANASVNIKNEINTNIVNVNNRIEALENYEEQTDKIEVTESEAKTQFSLSKEPNETTIVLEINGIEYRENEAFTANRGKKEVTWTATKAKGGFDITKELTPMVRVIYKVGKKMEYQPGEADKVITVCDFNKEDAGQFVIDGESAERSQKVVFDGVMKLGTEYSIPVGKPEKLGDGYISESEEIDFADYKKMDSPVRSLSAFEILWDNDSHISGIPQMYTIGPGCITKNPLPKNRVIKFKGHCRQGYCYFIAMTRKTVSWGGDYWNCKIDNSFVFGKADYGEGFYATVNGEGGVRNVMYEGKIIGDFEYEVTIDPVNKNLTLYYDGKCYEYIDENAELFNGDDLYLVCYRASTFYSTQAETVDLSTIEASDYMLYRKGEELYGMENGSWKKLSDAYKSLSSADKEQIFLATNSEMPSTTDLSSLGKFVCLNYSLQQGEELCRFKAVPDNQLVLPRRLIRLESFEGIDKATLTSKMAGSGICKLIVTTDHVAYQTYDFTAREWRKIDYTDLAAVMANGIDVAALQSIDRSAWDKLLRGKAGIGFAYLLSIEDITDTCSVDQLELQVDLQGSWDKAVQG